MTEELQAIAASVRKFAESELAPYAVQWDQDKHFPVDVLRRAGDLGLGGICVAEDVGGSGLGRLEAVTIFEELARGDTAIAAYVSIHNMVASMIDKAGTPEQRERWIPGMAAMEDLGSYCLTEPEVGSDAGALRTTAKRDGDEYVLDGVKQFISGAGSSSVYVVMARTGVPGPRGISAFIVPGDAPGLSFGANERKMGWNTQPTRQVIFEGVRVPVDQRLGEEGDGFGIAMRGLNGGRLNIAACSLGGAQWALEQATRYLQTRSAFGAPLISQQALLFQLADMDTDLTAARCLLLHAAESLDDQAADAVKICAMAKRFVTDAAFTVANSALQLHGGYGYLSEYGIEKVVRDLRVHQILEGTNEIMRLIIGRALVEEAA
ncbi:acyl-CoA dehydrogenase [Kribbella antibiotica]|uniref:Acyl-CoA dehydrogenase n=1 Tax=Kribbella antibiotica TaxID=190195 RepID=A0A4V2YQS8_9ACTN|nr:acyl-CoA dehydrogenase family protein [Kribbella antibiotica]TDD63277.1 acyl-CoA dehydrogenase [Kribbella antibiotica]